MSLERFDLPLEYALGALALAVLGYFWARRKRHGDQTIEDEFSGQATSDSADPIGASKPAAGAAQHVVTATAATPTDDLFQCGLQYQTLMAQADKAAGLALGRRYLGMLLNARNEPEALKVFRECLAADAAFKPEDPEHVLPLAKAARVAGDAKAAVAAVRGFDRAHPGHAMIPEVYVFSAKLMAEDLGNLESARRILKHVLEAYPGHYLAPEAKRLLKSMRQPA